jgi:hypothetical protein
MVEFGHEAGGKSANPFADALDGNGSYLLGLRLGICHRPMRRARSKTWNG